MLLFSLTALSVFTFFTVELVVTISAFLLDLLAPMLTSESDGAAEYVLVCFDEFPVTSFLTELFIILAKSTFPELS